MHANARKFCEAAKGKPMTQQIKIKAQAVGAFGEKATEAELLRRGWIPANVNPTVKNAADFDIFALKGNCTVHLRVKTSGPGQNAFQFGGFVPGKEITFDNLRSSDFTILVRMGEDRQNDDFYILRTRVVREQLNKYRQRYLATPRRDGFKRKDLGHWTLRLAEMRSGEDRDSYGFAKKWAPYRDNWSLLDSPAED
jgi:hypothetical protein